MPVFSKYASQDPTGLWELVQDMLDCQRAAAGAEAAYEAAKATKALELKASGMPVGIIDKILKGDRDVNAKLVAFRCAEAEFKAAAEAVNVRKIEVRQQSEAWQQEYNS